MRLVAPSSGMPLDGGRAVVERVAEARRFRRLGHIEVTAPQAFTGSLGNEQRFSFGMVDSQLHGRPIPLKREIRDVGFLSPMPPRVA